MTSIFARKMRTASDVTVVLDHVGSTHIEASLELQLAKERRCMNAGQKVLPALENEVTAMAMLVSRSRLLWDVLAYSCSRLDFDSLGNIVFR